MGLAGVLDLDASERGRILVVDEQRASSQRIAGALNPFHDVILSGEPGEALAKAREEAIDLMIVSLGFGAFDGLRLCSQARSRERERNLPILLIADPDDRPKVLRGLELGVNDYLTRPIDRNELLARVRYEPAPETLRRPAAPIGAAIDRDGALRPADRPQQPPRARAPPSRDDRNRAPAPRGLDDDGSRHRSFQAGERHPRSRRRRFGAQGLRRSAAGDRPRRRPPLPAGRGGIRRRDAGRLARAKRRGSRSAPAGPRKAGRSPSTARPAPFRSRSRSDLPSGGTNGIPPSFIAGRTARSICRSRPAAIASRRTPRDLPHPDSVAAPASVLIDKYMRFSARVGAEDGDGQDGGWDRFDRQRAART